MAWPRFQYSGLVGLSAVNQAGMQWAWLAAASTRDIGSGIHQVNPHRDLPQAQRMGLPDRLRIKEESVPELADIIVLVGEIYMGRLIVPTQLGCNSNP